MINVEYAVNMSLKHVVAMSTKIVNNITYQWMNAQQGQHKFKSRSTIAYPIYNRKLKAALNQLIQIHFTIITSFCCFVAVAESSYTSRSTSRTKHLSDHIYVHSSALII